MVIQTGTSTGMKDLLADLRTFLIANNWVSEEYNTDGDVATTVFEVTSPPVGVGTDLVTGAVDDGTESVITTENWQAFKYGIINSSHESDV